MKKTLIYAAVVLSFATSCIKDSMNIDPTRSSEENFDPNYLLTSAQLDYGNVTEFQLYEMAPMVQILSSTFDYFGGGDKYNLFLNSYNDRFFTDGLTGAAKLLEAQSLAEKKDADRNSNLIQICKIMWYMTMQRVTDIYGDIPYSEAGKAKFGIQSPVYDKQEDIYRNMLSELDKAISALDETKPTPTGDLFYAGDIAMWKKLGNSLMLRTAMRLVKIDAATAKTYAEKASANTFSEIAQNAILKLDGGSNQATQNKASNALLESMPQVRWSKTFTDFLAANDDPRLYILSEKADTGLAFNNNIERGGLQYTKQSPAPAGFVNEVPQGMPNGYDLSGARGIATSPGYPGPTGTGNNISPLGNYARPKRAVFAARRALPVFIITYAQTEFLLAEAALRGWNVGGTAAQHYKNGLIAAMQSLQQLDGMIALAVPDIQAFADANPLDETSFETAMNDINSQYWVASLFDFPETWSNYRRSGYPQLVPVQYPGNITNGTIPRRLKYPLSENANNSKNYQTALSRMGGDDLPTYRVWWDKQ